MSNSDRLETAMVDALKQALTSAGLVSVPPGGALIWQWFSDLSSARTWHTHGPNPITYADIVGYSDIMRWTIEPHHVAILRAMDVAFIEDFYSKRSSGDETRSAPRPSGEISPELFDAVFG